MKITFDIAKQEKTLIERKLDFKSVPEVFNGVYLEFPDIRKDYGEDRIITVGYLNKRMVIVVWTKRKGSKHIISMRKANEREQKKFKKRLEEITN